MKRSKKPRNHPWWYKKTKTDFNMYIRLLESDENGMGECITCKKPSHYKQAHAGHFIHGLHFIRENQHFQCPHCNLHLSGNLIEYTLYMQKRYGQEKIDELKFMKNQVRKYGIPELREKRAKIKEDIKRLKANKEDK